MEGTITLKTHLIYNVEVSNVKMVNSSERHPASGTLYLSDIALKGIAESAKQLGSWQATQEMELAVNIEGKEYNLGILVKGLPIENSVNFQTVQLATSA